LSLAFNAGQPVRFGGQPRSQSESSPLIAAIKSGRPTACRRLPATRDANVSPAWVTIARQPTARHSPWCAPHRAPYRDEIGELQPAEMIALIHIRREDEAVHGDAALQRLAPQIALRRRSAQSSQSTLPGRRLQEAAPEIEDARGKFERLIKTTEDETCVRQAGFRA